MLRASRGVCRVLRGAGDRGGVGEDVRESEGMADEEGRNVDGPNLKSLP